MSMSNQPTGVRALTIPTGVTLSSYTSYEDAQRAVDHLSDHDHDVKLVSIVGEDLRLVERITGSLNYGKVAGSGALTGAWFGLMMALVMWLVIGNFGLVDFLIPVLVGAAFGVLLGIVGYALRPKTRDFTSSSTVVAKRYTVLAGPTVADEMRAALQQAGLLGSAPGPGAGGAGGGAGAFQAGGGSGAGAGSYGAGPGGPQGGGAAGSYGAGSYGAPAGAHGAPAGSHGAPAGSYGAPHGAGPDGGHAGGEGAVHGHDAWTPGADRAHDAGPAGDSAHAAPAGQDGEQGVAPAPGIAPGADGTPRYGARLEDLTPEQRAHAEDQLRQADAHRSAPETGQPDQQ